MNFSLAIRPTNVRPLSNNQIMRLRLSSESAVNVDTLGFSFAVLSNGGRIIIVWKWDTRENEKKYHSSLP